jgi:predicted phosphodiesterase
MPIHKYGIIPDTHVPYEDKRKFDLVLKVLSALEVHGIIILGDFFDFYQVSDHDKDPARRFKLHEDIEYGKGRLKELQQTGAKNLQFIEGNHEWRMTRYIWKNAPELAGFESLAVPSLLGLADLSFKFTGYRKFLRIGKMNFTHDTGDAGLYAHYRSQAAFEGNVCIGHTHRMGYCVVGNARGKPHVACMFGWLGDVEEIDYEHRIKVLRNSAHGFGIGYHDTDTGAWTIVPIPFINNTVVVEGRLFKG